MHGWSTWLVYRLPTYLSLLDQADLAGTADLHLAGLRMVNIQLSTLAGKLKACLDFQTRLKAGEMALVVPLGATAEDFAAEG
jgi:hypothetical protein